MNRVLPLSLDSHWKNPHRLIQIILGPRQVGKTTAILSRLNATRDLFASADLPTPPTTEFILTQWTAARALRRKHPSTLPVRLILDEIQKIPRWSEIVKGLWDEDLRTGCELEVWLLGSSAILIERGLSESLTGRFELNFFPHWTFGECQKIFGITLQNYAHFGGYPKAYSFLDDLARGDDYIQNSILETTLGRDILSLHAVEKPALLRQLFWYVSKLPAHIVSYEKILSHLQGKGNSATLVHYAELLNLAFILCPLNKFSNTAYRTKKSQPKWIIPNPALIDSSLKKDSQTAEVKDFVFENLVGAHLCNLTFGSKIYSIQYWREKNIEIDFIITKYNQPLLAIEVKSGRIKNLPSLALLKTHGLDCPWVVIHPQNVNLFLSYYQIEEILEFYCNLTSTPQA